MAAHPIIAVAALLELIAAGAAIFWGWTAFQMLLAPPEGTPSRARLRLERRFEAGEMAGSAAHLLWIVAFGLFVIAVATALPGAVPGTMCGTGVIRAMSGEGGPAVALRLLLLALMGARLTLRRLTEKHPECGLEQTTARIALIVAAVGLLSTLRLLHAFAVLNLKDFQDCCAAARDAASPLRGIPLNDTVLGVGFFGSLAAIVVLFVALRALPRFDRPLALSTTAAAALFVPFGGAFLVNVLSAYHFGTLGHACAWCLFAARHYAAGYPLFAALLVLAIETVSLFTATMLSSRPVLRETARARMRTAATRILASALFFTLLAALPAILWRIRFGVWMTGS